MGEKWNLSEVVLVGAVAIVIILEVHVERLRCTGNVNGHPMQHRIGPRETLHVGNINRIGRSAVVREKREEEGIDAAFIHGIFEVRAVVRDLRL